MTLGPAFVLPSELIDHVNSYLDANSLAKLRETCRMNRDSVLLAERLKKKIFGILDQTHFNFGCGWCEEALTQALRIERDLKNAIKIVNVVYSKTPDNANDIVFRLGRTLQIEFPAHPAGPCICEID